MASNLTSLLAQSDSINVIVKWTVIVLMLVWIVVMWAVVAYSLWRGWAPFIKNKRQPKVRVPARVKIRADEHEFDPLVMQMGCVRKLMVFECEDGVDRAYDVHENVFDMFEESDRGVLTYQGDHFVSFEADSPKIEHDALQKKLMRS